MMTLNEYQKLAARTIDYEHMGCGEMANHALHGMVGEIGELHSMYQKIYQGHKFNKNMYKRELGDLLWFIAEYCTAMGWELKDIAQINIDKLKKRYPEGFDPDKSLNREVGDV